MCDFTEERFLNDVANHQMAILRDEGIYRHIRFSRPGTMCMHFDIITWPGYLCYTGDMGTYVFRRLNDMFEFFRTDRENMRLKDGKTLAVNISYWAEKVEANDRDDGLNKFSAEQFNRAVIEELVKWIRENASRTTREERRELWDTVINDVINADGQQTAAALEFSHYVNDRAGNFCFQDFCDQDLEEYAGRFIWCCYALTWGIQKYDAAKSAIDLKAA